MWLYFVNVFVYHIKYIIATGTNRAAIRTKIGTASKFAMLNINTTLKIISDAQETRWPPAKSLVNRELDINHQQCHITSISWSLIGLNKENKLNTVSLDLPMQLTHLSQVILLGVRTLTSLVKTQPGIGTIYLLWNLTFEVPLCWSLPISSDTNHLGWIFIVSLPL